MSKMNEFREKMQKKSRFEWLRSMMTSFVATTVVVVVAIAVIPASPVASIERIEAYHDAVMYQIDVTDRDQSIISGSLKVVLENQFEHHENSLTLGLSSGIFSSLQDNTQYQLSVYADKGFGAERLSSRKIKTQPRAGGSIIGETLLTDTNEYQLDYQIELYLHDIAEEYSEIWLRYALVYPEEEEVSSYTTLPLSVNQSSVIIEGIDNYNVQVVMILEGARWSGENEVLDQFVFYTPFRLYNSFYISRIGPREIETSFYGDSSSEIDVDYRARIILNGKIIEEKKISASSDSSYDYGSSVIFNRLKPQTTYSVELVAKYQHPYWLTVVEEVIAQDVRSTNGDFQYQIVVEEGANDYTITVVLTDPNHNFQLAYYAIYQIEPMYEWQSYSQSFGFTPDGDQKHVTFVISKPDIVNFRIEIGVRSQTDYLYYSVLRNIKP